MFKNCFLFLTCFSRPNQKNVMQNQKSTETLHSAVPSQESQSEIYLDSLTTTLDHSEVSLVPPNTINEYYIQKYRNYFNNSHNPDILHEASLLKMGSSEAKEINFTADPERNRVVFQIKYQASEDPVFLERHFPEVSGSLNLEIEQQQTTTIELKQSENGPQSRVLSRAITDLPAASCISLHGPRNPYFCLFSGFLLIFLFLKNLYKNIVRI